MKRVICVDDEPDLQNVFRVIFERAGYETIVYPGGDILLHGKFPLPDIFILDNQLPDVNGVEICRALKSRDSTRHIPVLLISATPSLAGDARSAGADAFMEKPFKVKALLQMVQKLVSGATAD